MHDWIHTIRLVSETARVGTKSIHTIRVNGIGGIGYNVVLGTTARVGTKSIHTIRVNVVLVVLDTMWYWVQCGIGYNVVLGTRGTMWYWARYWVRRSSSHSDCWI
jgi:hypothetical protein